MKKTLISFIVFALIVLICRHIVADIKQEERICVLENMLANLSLVNDSLVENETWRNQDSDSTEQVGMEYKTVRSKYIPVVKDAPKVTSTEQVRSKPEVSRKDTLKFSNPILLDINLVDSATLVRVPGIGEKTASIILRYREQLGGFYNPYQLQEKLTWDNAWERMDEWCTLWFKADARQIKKIKINTADFKQILRHPYINYDQTKALVQYRDKHKRIESIEVLRMLDVFSENDIARLSYYIDVR